MRPGRPSLTATLVAAVRTLYATFPSDMQVAPDPDAEALVPFLFRLPAQITAKAPWTVPAFHYGLGAVSLGLTFHVALRTLAIDDAVRSALRSGIRQLVLLGAGLDNRAARLPEARNARVFEVDHPDTQRAKQQRIETAHKARSRDDEPHGEDRIFVPVNFETDDLEQRLAEAGLRADLPTFWIWEGVTPYLTPSAVDQTLRSVSDYSAPGSLLALTYMRPAEELGTGISRLAVLAAEVVGESLHARFHKHELAQRLAEVGFSVRSDEADIDFANRYFHGNGSLSSQAVRFFPEWERVAIAERIQARD